MSHKKPLSQLWTIKPAETIPCIYKVWVPNLPLLTDYYECLNLAMQRLDHLTKMHGNARLDIVKDEDI